MALIVLAGCSNCPDKTETFCTKFAEYSQGRLCLHVSLAQAVCQRRNIHPLACQACYPLQHCKVPMQYLIVPSCSRLRPSRLLRYTTFLSDIFFRLKELRRRWRWCQMMEWSLCTSGWERTTS